MIVDNYTYLRVQTDKAGSPVDEEAYWNATEQALYLFGESNLSSDGPPVSVIHYPNSQSKAALEFINEGAEFVYFTRDCKLTTKEVIPLRNGALLLSEGREFVENENGCIAFDQRRNRIKLIVNEKCFNRKFAKVNPILTSLRSVVEVVNPSL